MKVSWKSFQPFPRTVVCFFCDGRKKTKKQEKTPVKHIRIRLIGGCENNRHHLAKSRADCKNAHRRGEGQKIRLSDTNSNSHLLVHSHDKSDILVKSLSIDSELWIGCYRAILDLRWNLLTTEIGERGTTQRGMGYSEKNCGIRRKQEWITTSPEICFCTTLRNLYIQSTPLWQSFNSKMVMQNRLFTVNI